MDAEQRNADPYFKITTETKKDISPRVPAKNNNLKIKCQINLNKLFGDGEAASMTQRDGKENMLNNAPNEIKFPGKFAQKQASCMGIPILIKPIQKGPPKIPPSLKH